MVSTAHLGSNGQLTGTTFCRSSQTMPEGILHKRLHEKGGNGPAFDVGAQGGKVPVQRSLQSAQFQLEVIFKNPPFVF